MSPLVVLRVASLNLAIPVVREAYLVELLTIASDVLTSSDFGVLTCLNGKLLSRQTIGIVAHRVKHIETLLTLVTRVDV